MSDPASPRKAAPDLCIINYNGSRYLYGSLGRVKELRDQFGVVAFVDDASTDDSLSVARKVLPEARFVALARNGGPGPARNAGLAALEGTRVFFMDNDVLLGDETIDRLTRAMDDAPGAAMALPRVVSAEEPSRIEYDGGGAHYSGLVSLRNAGKFADPAMEATARTEEIGSLISCCFLFDRSRWGTGLVFDEQFGMYGDDHELGLRARILGHDLLAVPSAVCLHGRGTPGVSIRETGVHTPVRIRNTILNRWQVILKLYEPRSLLLLTPYLVAFEVFQLAGCVALGWGREWLRAARALFGLLPSLRSRRREVQRARRRPDRAVLEGGPHPFNPALRRKRLLSVALPCLDALGSVSWAWTALGSREARHT